MPKLDISKIATRTTLHYEPLERKLYATQIARLRSITEHGRELLGRAPDYCQLERTLIARILAGKPISKAKLMAEFGFPGRIFNAALDSARGLVASARTNAMAALADTQAALARALVQYGEAEANANRQGELHGRRRRIQRLVEQESRQEQLVLRPRIFFGRAEYQTQHRPGWKEAYQAKRADHLSANGGADEHCGNKTLQISLGPIEAIITKREASRLWQHFHVRHARKLVATFRLPVKECAELARIVQANTVAPKLASTETWFDGRGKRISTKMQAKMHLARIRPASAKHVQRAITKDRVGLTIDLRRHDPMKRWYIHVSWEEKSLPEQLSPVGWLGVDINCDSLASAMASVEQGDAVLHSYAKHYYPAGGPAGTRRAELCRIIGLIVNEAKARNLGVALEYLDFEHCKRWLKSKLGSMLRAMPYRQIRAIFERRCLEAGVPLRYVPPKYSSLLGALLSVRWPMLGRDQAAAAVMSLRASATGNPWLEMACAQAAKAERLRLRLNRKGQFGHTLTVLASPPERSSNGGPARQMDSAGYPVEPALQWQVACGRKVRDAFSTLAAQQAAKLRELRRAADAQKRIQPVSILRLEVPSWINLGPYGFPVGSSLRRSA